MNQNNHPFTSVKGFSLAHNGVIYNDKELRMQYYLPKTNIQTDSYIAVQLLDYCNQLDFNSIKFMAEMLEGSFAISILNQDNTLYLVKESNPIYLIHFKSLGLFIYTSTKEIMLNALSRVNLNAKYKVVQINQGDILSINSMGVIKKEKFDVFDVQDINFDYFDTELDILLEYCGNIGVEKDIVYNLLDYGFELDEIETIVNDNRLLKDAIDYFNMF